MLTGFACWIVLLIPQLIEQWKLKSAEGISLGTVIIWVAGDLSNLIGAVWSKLLPPVILLAVWFCIIDGLLLVLYVYYTHIFPKYHKIVRPTTDEETALLGRRKSAQSRRDLLTSLVVASSQWSIFKKYVLPVLFVSAAGVLGYFVSSGSDDPISEPEQSFAAQFFGYFSAVCYLGARIPQILYNYHRKSVHGLSLLFILFSTFGNLTYALQILIYRNDWDYVMLNMPWLLGSLGAIFEDAFIFAQFVIYEDANDDDALVEVES